MSKDRRPRGEGTSWISIWWFKNYARVHMPDLSDYCCTGRRWVSTHGRDRWGSTLYGAGRRAGQLPTATPIWGGGLEAVVVGLHMEYLRMARGTGCRRRVFCHIAGAPSPSLLKHLLKAEGGAAERPSRRRRRHGPAGPRDAAGGAAAATAGARAVGRGQHMGQHGGGSSH